MKKLQLKKWKCRENDIEAVHNNKGYAYQRKLDALEEVKRLLPQLNVRLT
ncbi:hypothetical protein ACVPOS_02555 [Staphylococcus aureus]